jgi:hypothetical protein
MAVGVGALFLAQVLHAQTECAVPDAPTIPDGSTATEAELVNTVGLFKAYQQELVEFRDCLTEYEEELGDDITEEQNAAMVQQYNSSVDTEESLAGELNEAIQAFRAASGG